MAWYDNIFDFNYNDSPSSGSQSSSGTQGFNGMGDLGQGNLFGDSSSGGGLADLFKMLKGGADTFKQYGGGTLVKGLGAAYDAYSKNKTAKSILPQLQSLRGMYQPGTPEALQMQKEMEARDAAAGRRSQYGTRSVELAGNLAKNRSNVLSSPGYLNLEAAYAGANNNKYKGFADLFGDLLSDKRPGYADGGQVGGNADIQWKGTESGLVPKEFQLLAQSDMVPNVYPRQQDTQLFNKSWKFDDGPRQLSQEQGMTNQYGDLPDDASLMKMADAITGRGDTSLAEFYRGTGDLSNTGALAQEGMDKWTSGYNDVTNRLIDFLNNRSGPVGRGDPVNQQRAEYQSLMDAYNQYIGTMPTSYKLSIPTAPTMSQFNNRFNQPISFSGASAGAGGTGSAGAGVDMSSRFGLPTFGGFSGSGSGGSSLSLGPVGSFSSFADGGHVPGYDPHGQDDVDAKLTRGEYVLPVDVVDAIGVENLDRLKDMFHKPKRG